MILATETLSALHAIILGIVEGLTEFLPISSTAHLTIVQRLLGIGSGASKEAADTYTIAIQLGAIFAVIAVYRPHMVRIGKGIIGRDEQGRRLGVNLILAFLPAGFVGFLADDTIKTHLFGVWPILVAWAVGGIFLLIWKPNTANATVHSVFALAPTTALIIGSAQVFAMWPGISRSLVTIVAALVLGLSMQAAVEFSFLLGALTLSAATTFDLLKHGDELVNTFGLATPLLGFFVAFLAAWAAVRWMLGFLKSHPLSVFGWYRIGAAAVVAILTVTPLL